MNTTTSRPWRLRLVDAKTGEVVIVSHLTQASPVLSAHDRTWLMRWSAGHRRRTGNGLRADWIET